jgi:hypothetical protein
MTLHEAFEMMWVENNFNELFEFETSKNKKPLKLIIHLDVT